MHKFVRHHHDLYLKQGISLDGPPGIKKSNYTALEIIKIVYSNSRVISLIIYNKLPNAMNNVENNYLLRTKY